MRYSFTLLFAILLFNVSGQDLSGFHLEAHYPFSTDPTDASSNYGDASVDNVVYSEGGIYSNGLFSGVDTTGSYIKTPDITGFSGEEFALQVDVRPEVQDQIILTAGHFWRWLQLYIDSEGKFEILVSMTNGFAQVVKSDAVATLGEWQTVTLIFDEAALQLDLYLGEDLVLSQAIDAPLMYEDDYSFSNEDGGLGKAYKGHWKDLKIFNNDPSSGTNESYLLLDVQVIPNVTDGMIRVEGSGLSHSAYRLFASNGEMILNGLFSSNEHRLNLSDLADGLYYLQLVKNDAKVVRRLVVSK